MRQRILHFSVALITLGLGIAVANLYPHLEDLIVEKLSGTPKLEASAEFKPTLRGCGVGYFQLYELADGKKMVEGSACFANPRLAQQELEKRISSAIHVVERVPNAKNRFGNGGERTVLSTLPDDFGNNASILWYGGDNCFLYIEAPSLQTALEFERSNAYAF